MLFSRVLLTIFVAQFEVSTAIHCNKRFMKSRQNFRDVLEDNGVIFVTFSYKRLEVNKSFEEFGSNHYLKSGLLMPLSLIQSEDALSDEFKLTIDSNLGIHIRYAVLFSYELNFDDGISFDENCNDKNMKKNYSSESLM